MGRVDIRDASEYTSEDKVIWSSRVAVSFIDQREQLVNLIWSANKRVHSPILLDIVDLRLHAGNYAKVVTGATQSPEQVRVAAAGCRDGSAICEHYTSRHYVVKRVSIAIL